MSSTDFPRTFFDITIDNKPSTPRASLPHFLNFDIIMDSIFSHVAHNPGTE
jgi:hypothetical protein